MSKRLGRNVRLKDGSYQSYVQSGGTLHTKTWPLTTPLPVIRDWVATIKRERPRVRRGTLADDARRYLDAVASLRSFADRQHDISLWVARFGTRATLAIKPYEIRATLAGWLEAGRAPATVKHRRAALSHLYTVLYPDWPYNPVRAVPAPRVPPAEPRGLPYAIVDAILAAMPDRGPGRRGEKRAHASATKARLRVEAYTGLPHAQLVRLRRADVDWLGQTLLVPSRRKGSGVAGRRLPLTEAAIVALRAYDALNLWQQPFSRASVGKAFQRAAKKVRAALAEKGVTLPPIRVYDLRHSYGSAAYALTGDIRAVADLLQHSSTTLTQRYTLAAVDIRLRAVRDALGEAWADKSLPPESAANQEPPVTH